MQTGVPLLVSLLGGCALLQSGLQPLADQVACPLIHMYREVISFRCYTRERAACLRTARCQQEVCNGEYWQTVTITPGRCKFKATGVR